MIEAWEPMTLSEVAALPAVVDLMTAARALRIKRTTAYALARGGSFPCPVLRVGGAYRVPTAGLLRVLGLAT
ncbi:helix-turn-helix domain-containing protein [Amycolatopsis sp. SID8362]|uniref:helix-turn-helix domain-containing protein n=1 Tax=Amycolatopsis sp. SID8362 TaxID=2690346 RepID=UPI00136AD4E9|nr:helix-turn-helix domain-containing protein [Amycolatopsis sp. SID8362]NBH07738.1 DNA-binding protein [Amycolatopsis sp. SID8362]NED44433.1 helix-turn-helix domain-containing protein [Amycolatopsis sp. SID8362]